MAAPLLPVDIKVIVSRARRPVNGKRVPFLPAGTIAYRNAWLLMGLPFIPMLVVSAVLLVKDKQLLEKRLRSKKRESEQRNKGSILENGLAGYTEYNKRVKYRMFPFVW